MEKRVLLRVGGMTCVNCQHKIEKRLSRIPGVIHVRVSYANGTAEIEYDPDRVSVQKVEAIIRELDYEVLRGDGGQAPGPARTACILVLIAALYAMLQFTGILNRLAPSRLADSGMGYGMLFVIGLITSVHCIAMCGGINLSQCIPRRDTASEDSRRLSTLRPAVLYNLGRVVSYTAVGFVLGLAGFLVGGGTQTVIGTHLQGMLKLLAGVFMVIMGINMLGLFPALRKLTIRVPGLTAQRAGLQRRKGNGPFWVGCLNGFMPCGPLQSMWIVALAAADPLTGALSMLLFSLGTVPLMLGLGSAVSVLGKKFTNEMMTVGAVLVTVLGLAMLSQGGSLSGWLPSDLLLILVIVFCAVGILLSLPVKQQAAKKLIGAACVILVAGSVLVWSRQELSFGGGEADPSAMLEITDGVQVVHSTLQAGAYPDITVQVGIPVRWVIDAPQGSITGCNRKMLIPALGLEHTFSTGENIIEFTPEETGTIRYSCWMGMIRGNIFVTDGSENGALAVGDVTEPTPSGYSIPTDQIAVASVAADTQGNLVQEVSIRLTEEGFEPAVVVVQEGIGAIWTIDADLGDSDAGIDLLAPNYAAVLSLSNGRNQLSLYPTEDFDVAVGDYGAFAYVKVVDDLEAVDESAVRAEVAEYEPLIYPADTYAGTGMSCCS